MVVANLEIDLTGAHRRHLIQDRVNLTLTLTLTLHLRHLIQDMVNLAAMAATQLTEDIIGKRVLILTLNP